MSNILHLLLEKWHIFILCVAQYSANVFNVSTTCLMWSSILFQIMNTSPRQTRHFFHLTFLGISYIAHWKKYGAFVYPNSIWTHWKLPSHHRNAVLGLPLSCGSSCASTRSTRLRLWSIVHHLVYRCTHPCMVKDRYCSLSCYLVFWNRQRNETSHLSSKQTAPVLSFRHGWFDYSRLKLLIYFSFYKVLLFSLWADMMLIEIFCTED